MGRILLGATSGEGRSLRSIEIFFIRVLCLIFDSSATGDCNYRVHLGRIAIQMIRISHNVCAEDYFYAHLRFVLGDTNDEK